MRNGFTKTLAAVAMACLGYQAFAVVPVVGNVPSPVVTDDAQPVTGSYNFVYADFIDLDDYVSDDGDIANIVWSFASAANEASSPAGGIYAFNAADPLNLSTDDPATPPLAAQISREANITVNGESNPDGLVNTPTVRDITLSPFGGPNVPAGSTPGEILNMDVITLFASDGTTAGSNSFVAYTAAYGDGSAGGDRLSAAAEPPPVNESTINFATGTNNWVQGQVVGGTVMSSTGGLSASVTLANSASIGEWVSPYGIIDLVANSVWRLRASMASDQGTVGSQPLWDVIVHNFDNVGGAPATFGYATDNYFLDNTGGASRIQVGAGPGLSTFEIWTTPLAVRTAQWNNPTTGAFTAARDAANDMQIIFRLLHAHAAGINAQQDSGQLTMTGLVIDRFDLDNQNPLTNVDVYTIGTTNPWQLGANGVTVTEIIGGGSNPFTASQMDILPPPGGWTLELTQVIPGDGNDPIPSDPSYAANAAQVLDNYPILHEANQLYEIQAELSAPDANAVTDGPDAVRLGYNTKTFEHFADFFMLSGLDNVGMPRTGASQTYTAFFWSHNPTSLAAQNVDRLRWRFEVLNSDTFNTNRDNANNTGGVRIHSIKVRKVSFFGQ
jgi:hypothetical protein